MLNRLRVLVLTFAGLVCLLGSGHASAMYDPGTGRFMQRDPLGYPDGMNSYAAYHVMRDGVDPWGLEVRRLRGDDIEIVEVDAVDQIRRNRAGDTVWGKTRPTVGLFKASLVDSFLDGPDVQLNVWSELYSDECFRCERGQPVIAFAEIFVPLSITVENWAYRMTLDDSPSHFKDDKRFAGLVSQYNALTLRHELARYQAYEDIYGGEKGIYESIFIIRCTSELMARAIAEIEVKNIAKSRLEQMYNKLWDRQEEITVTDQIVSRELGGQLVQRYLELLEAGRVDGE